MQFSLPKTLALVGLTMQTCSAMELSKDLKAVFASLKEMAGDNNMSSMLKGDKLQAFDENEQVVAEITLSPELNEEYRSKFKVALEKARGAGQSKNSRNMYDAILASRGCINYQHPCPGPGVTGFIVCRAVSCDFCQGIHELGGALCVGNS